MKKIFSIASALMLALGMGMTSCSNDIDEVVTEQQPEMHKLYLSASVPQTPETRSYAEGVEGKEDAIKITGWKAGDVIYGLYYPGSGNKTEKLAFTFNGTTQKFESASTTVTNDQIKYFVYGDFDFSKGNGLSYNDYGGAYITGDLYLNPLIVDIANNFTNIPMWGAASVDGGKLTTDMKMAGNMAFLCLHNSSTASIDVRIARQTTESTPRLYYVGANSTCLYVECASWTSSVNFRWKQGTEFQDRATATVTTIAAGQKAYIPILYQNNSNWTVQVFIGDSESSAFTPKEVRAFIPGKIYKATYTGQ